MIAAAKGVVRVREGVGECLYVTTVPAVRSLIKGKRVFGKRIGEYHAGKVACAQEVTLQKIVGKDAFLTKRLWNEGVKGGNIQDPLAAKDPLAKKRLITVKCGKGVRINATASAKQTGKARGASRFGCEGDARL